jgi:hypothetical protein
MTPPPGIPKGIRFGMDGRIVFLDPPVVATPEQAPLTVEEGRADRDAPFRESQLGFRNCDS